MTERSAAQSRISVIVVSDYAGDSGERADELRMLHALKAQDIAEPFEIVLAESGRNGPCPPALLEIAPNIRAVSLPHTSSSTLKDAALSFTSGSFVAVFEADAPPQPDWLRLAVSALDRDPEAAAISGHTRYADGSLQRAAALIDRGYLELREAGATPFVCNNGALYRRNVLERFPYPDEPNPFVSGRLRSDAMARAGLKFLFDPAMVSVHQFGGLRFMREVRRNAGFSDARVAFLRRKSPKLSAKQTAVIQYRLARERTIWEWRTCRRAARHFIRWYDWPAVIVLMAIYRLMELPAQRIGLSGAANLPSTPYR